VRQKCIFVVTQFKEASVVSSLKLSTYTQLNANNLVLLEFFGVIEKENLSREDGGIWASMSKPSNGKVTKEKVKF
jgi:hypothetical protein